jgi:hypothetical protein
VRARQEVERAERIDRSLNNNPDTAGLFPEQWQADADARDARGRLAKCVADRDELREQGIATDRAAALWFAGLMQRHPDLFPATDSVLLERLAELETAIVELADRRGGRR